jgi:probable HAF family extracellular repeat protein
MRSLLLCLPILLILLSQPAAAQSEPLYRMRFLPANSTPYALGPLGEIVGQAATGRAFLWSDDSFGELDTPGSEAVATSISRNGLVAGGFLADDGLARPFLYRDGVGRALMLPGDAPGQAWGVNSAGALAGTYVGGTGDDRGFLLRGGSFTDLGDLGGGITRAAGINDAGMVVGHSWLTGLEGFHAFRWSEGKLSDLGTLGGPSSWASAVNAHGVVAGTSFTAAEIQHAFLWDGAMRDLGSLGGEFTEARALNDFGDVVGYSTLPDHIPGLSFSHAFLYRDGAMHDLNALVDRPGVWTILDAVGINAEREIAAYACTDIAFEDCRAVLLEPLPAIPEPPGWLLVSTALALLGAGKVSAASRCA